MKPKKACISLTLFGLGQFWILLILLEKMVNPDRNRIYLRYSMELEWNSHFSTFTYKLESIQYFFDMFLLAHVVQINQDIIEVYNYTSIKKIWKDIIYELLEDCCNVSQTKRLYCLFERSIMSLESHLSFIAFYDPY